MSAADRDAELAAPTDSEGGGNNGAGSSKSTLFEIEVWQFENIAVWSGTLLYVWAP